MRASKLRNGLVAGACLGLVLALAAFVPVNLGVTHIRTEVDIARTPHDVFEYASTPANWPKWHPSSIAVAGDASHSLVPGESVVEEFRVAGRHGWVKWRVISRDPDRLWRIEGDIDGHVAGVITYTISDIAGGAHFARDFEYPSPTILFAALNTFLLRPRVAEESRQAAANLRTVLESRK